MGLQLLDNVSCVNQEPWRHPSAWTSDRIMVPSRNGKPCAAVSFVATGHNPSPRPPPRSGEGEQDLRLPLSASGRGPGGGVALLPLSASGRGRGEGCCRKVLVQRGTP